MLDFANHTLLTNAILFSIAAVLVWFAGAKLSGYVDVYAERTGLGKAFAGALLLGGATSLPELATTLTAASSGAAELAGTNLLGGIVMQVAVLAVIDAVVLRGQALTLFAPRASLLMVGVMLIGLTALASAAISCGEIVAIAGIGLWPILLFAAYIFSLWIAYRYEINPRWEPNGQMAAIPEAARDLEEAHRQTFADITTTRLVISFAIASVVILLGGFLVARTGEALAGQTGIGQSFIGATLVALATSLPEVSTTYAAVRFGAYGLAAANILGTNCLALALFLPAELAYRDGPIFDALQPSAAFLAALGILATSIYLWGILERRDRTLWGMGHDSLAVLVVYGLGLGVYYYVQ